MKFSSGVFPNFFQQFKGQFNKTSLEDHHKIETTCQLIGFLVLLSISTK